MAISMTSAGIVYTGTNTPAQSAGTGSHYTLDDYEEGAWTISFLSGYNDSGVSNQNALTYTKIGRACNLQCYCEANTSGTNANFHSGGNPFTSTRGYWSGTYNSGGATTTASVVHVRLYTGNVQCAYYKGAQGAPVTGADIVNSHMIWSLTYSTA